MRVSQRYRALKGMQDVLPPDIHIWQKVEAAAKEIFNSYGFREMRPPVVEATDVFTRSIGEETDIVEKEMYVFTDKGGRSIALRPEGTASIVRSYVENHLFTLPSPQKYYYAGPMFRYERPQAGRQRQFYQIGVELFGSPHAAMDAEVISMLWHLLLKLDTSDLDFQINSIGCEKCRPAYKELLLSFFSDKLGDLCPDCRRRYTMNPLRILDCKVDRCREIRGGAPKVNDSLCGECRNHFDEVLSFLEQLNIPFTVNPDMVRGLDYYTRTTFEVTSSLLGAQNAVAAGGRYDRLVEEFGGPETPAIGFAIGMERLIELLKKSGVDVLTGPLVFLALIGQRAGREGFFIADRLRKNDIRVELGDHTASLKSQLRKADKISSEYVFIMGDDEIDSETLKWKRLSDSSQGQISLSKINEFLLKKA